MKTIGYLEGTNPEFLTKLVCMGYNTVPIGNDTDNHGKNIAFIFYIITRKRSIWSAFDKTTHKITMDIE